jgi:hypothetical protein
MSPENRTKFAIGHYLTEKPDDPASFTELAKRFAPRLREVYFPWPGLTNGRPHMVDIRNEEARTISDLKYCREHGMKLDLLANAACYGEKACTEEQRLQITGIIRRLDREGLYPEIITTTSPYIAKLCKLQFPDIEVRASVNMRLRNTLALEYLAPLFDSFYICRDVQRDLPTFHKMAAWCKDHGKKLCMLVNSGCVRDCPWHVFHILHHGHKYLDIFPEMRAQKLWFVCYDLYAKQKRFSEFLRGTWIRPEDVHLFEPELETIKLATRRTDYPFEILEAYLGGSFDGNLLHLTEPYQGSAFRPYRIDNKSFPADWATGGIAGKCADNCMHCGKCEQILDQVMKYDIDPAARVDGFSLTNNFYLLAPKKRQNYSNLDFAQKGKV